MCIPTDFGTVNIHTMQTKVAKTFPSGKTIITKSKRNIYELMLDDSVDQCVIAAEMINEVTTSDVLINVRTIVQRKKLFDDDELEGHRYIHLEMYNKEKCAETSKQVYTYDTSMVVNFDNQFARAMTATKTYQLLVRERKSDPLPPSRGQWNGSHDTENGNDDTLSMSTETHGGAEESNNDSLSIEESNNTVGELQEESSGAEIPTTSKGKIPIVTLRQVGRAEEPHTQGRQELSPSDCDQSGTSPHPQQGTATAHPPPENAMQPPVIIYSQPAAEVCVRKRSCDGSDEQATMRMQLDCVQISKAGTHCSSDCIPATSPSTKSGKTSVVASRQALVRAEGPHTQGRQELSPSDCDQSGTSPHPQQGTATAHPPPENAMQPPVIIYSQPAAEVCVRKRSCDGSDEQATMRMQLDCVQISKAGTHCSSDCIPATSPSTKSGKTSVVASRQALVRAEGPHTQGRQELSPSDCDQSSTSPHPRQGTATAHPPPENAIQPPVIIYSQPAAEVCVRKRSCDGSDEQATMRMQLDHVQISKAGTHCSSDCIPATSPSTKSGKTSVVASRQALVRAEGPHTQGRQELSPSDCDQSGTSPHPQQGTATAHPPPENAMQPPVIIYSQPAAEVCVRKRSCDGSDEQATMRMQLDCVQISKAGTHCSSDCIPATSPSTKSGKTSVVASRQALVRAEGPHTQGRQELSPSDCDQSGTSPHPQQGTATAHPPPENAMQPPVIIYSQPAAEVCVRKRSCDGSDEQATMRMQLDCVQISKAGTHCSSDCIPATSPSTKSGKTSVVASRQALVRAEGPHTQGRQELSPSDCDQSSTSPHPRQGTATTHPPPENAMQPPVIIYSQPAAEVCVRKRSCDGSDEQATMRMQLDRVQISKAGTHCSSDCIPATSPSTKSGKTSVVASRQALVRAEGPPTQGRQELSPSECDQSSTSPHPRQGTATAHPPPENAMQPPVIIYSQPAAEVCVRKRSCDGSDEQATMRMQLDRVQISKAGTHCSSDCIPATSPSPSTKPGKTSVVASRQALVRAERPHTQGRQELSPSDCDQSSTSPHPRQGTATAHPPPENAMQPPVIIYSQPAAEVCVRKRSCDGSDEQATMRMQLDCVQISKAGTHCSSDCIPATSLSTKSGKTSVVASRQALVRAEGPHTQGRQELSPSDCDQSSTSPHPRQGTATAHPPPENAMQPPVIIYSQPAAGVCVRKRSCDGSDEQATMRMQLDCVQISKAGTHCSSDCIPVTSPSTKSGKTSVVASRQALVRAKRTHTQGRQELSPSDCDQSSTSPHPRQGTATAHPPPENAIQPPVIIYSQPAAEVCVRKRSCDGSDEQATMRMQLDCVQISKAGTHCSSDCIPATSPSTKSGKTSVVASRQALVRAKRTHTQGRQELSPSDCDQSSTSPHPQQGTATAHPPPENAMPRSTIPSSNKLNGNTATVIFSFSVFPTTSDNLTKTDQRAQEMVSESLSHHQHLRPPCPDIVSPDDWMLIQALVIERTGPNFAPMFQVPVAHPLQWPTMVTVIIHQRDLDQAMFIHMKQPTCLFIQQLYQKLFCCNGSASVEMNLMIADPLLCQVIHSQQATTTNDHCTVARIKVPSPSKFNRNMATVVSNPTDVFSTTADETQWHFGTKTDQQAQEMALEPHSHHQLLMTTKDVSHDLNPPSNVPFAPRLSPNELQQELLLEHSITTHHPLILCDSAKGTHTHQSDTSPQLEPSGISTERSLAPQENITPMETNQPHSPMLLGPQVPPCSGQSSGEAVLEEIAARKNPNNPTSTCHPDCFQAKLRPMLEEMERKPSGSPSCSQSQHPDTAAGRCIAVTGKECHGTIGAKNCDEVITPCSSDGAPNNVVPRDNLDRPLYNDVPSDPATSCCCPSESKEASASDLPDCQSPSYNNPCKRTSDVANKKSFTPETLHNSAEGTHSGTSPQLEPSGISTELPLPPQDNITPMETNQRPRPSQFTGEAVMEEIAARKNHNNPKGTSNPDCFPPKLPGEVETTLSGLPECFLPSHPFATTSCRMPQELKVKGKARLCIERLYTQSVDVVKHLATEVFQRLSLVGAKGSAFLGRHHGSRKVRKPGAKRQLNCGQMSEVTIPCAPTTAPPYAESGKVTNVVPREGRDHSRARLSFNDVPDIRVHYPTNPKAEIPEMSGAGQQQRGERSTPQSTKNCTVGQVSDGTGSNESSSNGSESNGSESNGSESNGDSSSENSSIESKSGEGSANGGRNACSPSGSGGGDDGDDNREDDKKKKYHWKKRKKHHKRRKYRKKHRKWNPSKKRKRNKNNPVGSDQIPVLQKKEEAKNSSDTPLDACLDSDSSPLLPVHSQKGTRERRKRTKKKEGRCSEDGTAQMQPSSAIHLQKDAWERRKRTKKKEGGCSEDGTDQCGSAQMQPSSAIHLQKDAWERRKRTKKKEGGCSEGGTDQCGSAQMQPSSAIHLQKDAWERRKRTKKKEGGCSEDGTDQCGSAQMQPSSAIHLQKDAWERRKRTKKKEGGCSEDGTDQCGSAQMQPSSAIHLQKDAWERRKRTKKKEGGCSEGGTDQCGSAQMQPSSAIHLQKDAWERRKRTKKKEGGCSEDGTDQCGSAQMQPSSAIHLQKDAWERRKRTKKKEGGCSEDGTDQCGSAQMQPSSTIHLQKDAWERRKRTKKKEGGCSEDGTDQCGSAQMQPSSTIHLQKDAWERRKRTKKKEGGCSEDGTDQCGSAQMQPSSTIHLQKDAWERRKRTKKKEGGCSEDGTDQCGSAQMQPSSTIHLQKDAWERRKRTKKKEGGCSEDGTDQCGSAQMQPSSTIHLQKDAWERRKRTKKKEGGCSEDGTDQCGSAQMQPSSTIHLQKDAWERRKRTKKKEGGCSEDGTDQCGSAQMQPSSTIHLQKDAWERRKRTKKKEGGCSEDGTDQCGSAQMQPSSTIHLQKDAWERRKRTKKKEGGCSEDGTDQCGSAQMQPSSTIHLQKDAWERRKRTKKKEGGCSEDGTDQCGSAQMQPSSAIHLQKDAWERRKRTKIKGGGCSEDGTDQCGSAQMQPSSWKLRKRKSNDHSMPEHHVRRRNPKSSDSTSGNSSQGIPAERQQRKRNKRKRRCLSQILLEEYSTDAYSSEPASGYVGEDESDSEIEDTTPSKWSSSPHAEKEIRDQKSTLGRDPSGVSFQLQEQDGRPPEPVKERPSGWAIQGDPSGVSLQLQEQDGRPPEPVKERPSGWAIQGDPSAWAIQGDPSAWAIQGDPSAWESDSECEEPRIKAFIQLCGEAEPIIDTPTQEEEGDVSLLRDQDVVTCAECTQETAETTTCAAAIVAQKAVVPLVRILTPHLHGSFIHQPPNLTTCSSFLIAPCASTTLCPVVVPCAQVYWRHLPSNVNNTPRHSVVESHPLNETNSTIYLSALVFTVIHTVASSPKLESPTSSDSSCSNDSFHTAEADISSADSEGTVSYAVSVPPQVVHGLERWPPLNLSCAMPPALVPGSQVYLHPVQQSNLISSCPMPPALVPGSQVYLHPVQQSNLISSCAMPPPLVPSSQIYVHPPNNDSNNVPQTAVESSTDAPRELVLSSAPLPPSQHEECGSPASSCSTDSFHTAEGAVSSLDYTEDSESSEDLVGSLQPDPTEVLTMSPVIQQFFEACGETVPSNASIIEEKEERESDTEESGTEESSELSDSAPNPDLPSRWHQPIPFLYPYD